MCLYLPNWPAQRVRVAASADSDRPIAVHAPIRNLPRVAALNSEASKSGVTVGMPLAEAESLLTGEPLLAPLDAAADLAELRRLAALSGRFGPMSGIEEGDSPSSILIDVTGCGPFFGGEANLAREALRFLKEQAYAARVGLASTVGLAWAASRTIGRERLTLVPPGEEQHWLGPRPVTALRLDAATLVLLDGLGLRTVGDVLRLPRAELPSRFGPLLLRRIDQALGLLPEPIEPVRPAVPLAVRWSTETPLTNRSGVAHMLTRLVGRLVERLPVWEGVSALSCRFNEARPLVVGAASPARSVERLMTLVSLALDREPPPREVSRIIVTAETVRLPSPDRTNLFGDRTAAEQERSFRRLVERLAGRLGEDAVSRPTTTDDPLPERAVRSLPVTQKDRQQPPKHVTAAASRPILLLPEPEPVEVLAVFPDGPPHRLTRRGRSQMLVLALGPERFETGWANAPEARRDYWRVETDDAERLWLYRCRRTGGWFLHGLFG